MEAGSAAPAANVTATPAAKGSNGASTGTQTPVAKPPPKPNAEVSVRPVAPPKKPKPEAQREEKEPEDGDEPEKKPEPYRLKKKLKDGDREYEVDYGEDDIVRELSIAAAAKRRLGELNKGLKELAAEKAKFEAYKKNPESFLAESGLDAEEWAAKQLAAKAKRGLMSPEEQRINELEEENRRFKTDREADESRRKEEQETAAEAKRWEQAEPRFIAEMDRLKIPKSMSVLGLMSKVGAELEEALGADAATPEIVVRETHDRLTKFAEHYVFSLEPAALSQKLGPEVRKALQTLWLNEWRAKQQGAEPTPQVEAKPPPPPEAPGPKEYLSEAEVRRRIEEKWK